MRWHLIGGLRSAFRSSVSPSTSRFSAMLCVLGFAGSVTFQPILLQFSPSPPSPWDCRCSAPHQAVDLFPGVGVRSSVMHRENSSPLSLSSPQQQQHLRISAVCACSWTFSVQIWDIIVLFCRSFFFFSSLLFLRPGLTIQFDLPTQTILASHSSSLLPLHPEHGAVGVANMPHHSWLVSMQQL